MLAMTWCTALEALCSQLSLTPAAPIVRAPRPSSDVYRQLPCSTTQVPAVDLGRTSHRVMTMEFVDGERAGHQLHVAGACNSNVA